VSYDAAVSDDDRAQEVYLRKQLAAGIPVPPTAPPSTPGTPVPTGTATGTATEKGTGTTGGTAGGATAGTAPGAIAGATPSAPSPTASHKPAPTTTPPGKPTADGATPSGSPTTDPTGLEPRVLDGLGDIAYVDDVVSTVGANSRQRSISVVFRTSNVIVTVTYREQTTGSTEAPDSAELQEKARNLARQLAERLEE
jgi:hypothetical protein